MQPNETEESTTTQNQTGTSDSVTPDEKPVVESNTPETTTPTPTSAPEVDYSNFTLPEGVEVNNKLLEQATPMFKELGLTKDQAQKLVDFQAKQVQAQTQEFEKTKEDWLNLAKNDPAIGGDKFDSSIADAKLFLGKFGTPELSVLLNDFGLGNHPEFIKAFANAGKLLKEDSPGAGGSAVQVKKDRASILYGDN